MYSVEFISYGNGPFDINKFRSPKNIEDRNKSSGGLWASPVGYHLDWKEFLKNDPPSFFRFRLREGAKIYIIDCSKDLETLLSGNEVIDFEYFVGRYSFDKTRSSVDKIPPGYLWVGCTKLDSLKYEIY